MVTWWFNSVVLFFSFDFISFVVVIVCVIRYDWLVVLLYKLCLVLFCCLFACLLDGT